MYWLHSDELTFPPYEETNSEGIIALGGDLSPDRLELAYRKGIFPWYNKEEPVIWWCPDPRFVLFPEKLKVSKSTRKILQTSTFTVTYNQCFKKVMENCRTIERQGQEGTWIQPEMIEAYEVLHQRGLAKSVEVWNPHRELVGGLYGIDLGSVFCGESMFSKESNASKIGFITFIQNHDFQIIDCQVYTKYLESLGAEEISRERFLSYLP